ncbi:P-loop containing nucleoside triphosphate hydrolase protein [Bisporella sp. PMI_857]|nr:P-loop containing nucleoside triphosphate hydrolase protein [Bisporella sp. PMI_857]
MAPTQHISPPDARPIVISGPSGVGKGTLYKKLLAEFPQTFATTISNTTRQPRPGETRDVDYYYITMEEFEKMIEEGKFVEHAQFGGNRYGTSKKTIDDLEKGGKVVVLDIEMEGVKQIKQSPLSARYIFISPPSTTTKSPFQVLEERLRGRGTEDEKSIEKRLAQAQKELDYAKTEGVHDVIIYNDELDKAYEELKAFIFDSKTQ